MFLKMQKLHPNLFATSKISPLYHIITSDNSKLTKWVNDLGQPYREDLSLPTEIIEFADGSSEQTWTNKQGKLRTCNLMEIWGKSTPELWRIFFSENIPCKIMSHPDIDSLVEIYVTNSGNRLEIWKHINGSLKIDNDQPNMIFTDVHGSKTFDWRNQNFELSRLDDKPARMIDKINDKPTRMIDNVGVRHNLPTRPFKASCWTNNEGNYHRENDLPTQIYEYENGETTELWFVDYGILKRTEIDLPVMIHNYPDGSRYERRIRHPIDFSKGVSNTELSSKTIKTMVDKDGTVSECLGRTFLSQKLFEFLNFKKNNSKKEIELVSN